MRLLAWDFAVDLGVDVIEREGGGGKECSLFEYGCGMKGKSPSMIMM